MHAIALCLALAAAPFWEAKAPQNWTDDELHQLLNESPWAQAVQDGGVVLLASAKPIRDAERELERRRHKKTDPPADPEYGDFLEQDQGHHIVIAIAYKDQRPLADALDSGKMQEESVLKVGKKKFKMTGHFPPTPADPYLRLIFPREIGPNDKSVVLDLYLPGVVGMYRTAEFRLKDLLYHGKPEI